MSERLYVPPVPQFKRTLYRRRPAGPASTHLTTTKGRNAVDGTDAEASVRDRHYLPHWERTGAIYFVTFRLADALPRHILDQLLSERHLLEARFTSGARDLLPPERAKLDIVMAQRLERYLDAGTGACHLSKPGVADLVAGALGHFDRSRYQLFCWCLMPNYVHVVVQPLAPYKLPAIVHSWKSFTAKKANRILDTSGEFWQREYYDRMIRDEGHLRRVIEYVANNPAKARLEHWRWVYVSSRLEALITGEGAGQA
jgi:putative transposase